MHIIQNILPSSKHNHKGSQPLIPKLASRFTHVGSCMIPKIVCKVICLLICTNPALREQRIHPIVLYSSFTMEPSCRFKLLLSISGGYCPIILHRIKQRHIVRARFLSHVKRARARETFHFAQNTLSTLRNRATDRIKRAVSMASCCHNCGMTFLQSLVINNMKSFMVTVTSTPPNQSCTHLTSHVPT